MVLACADSLKLLPRGHHRMPCWQCDVSKPRPRDTALSVDVDEAGGVYFCHRCGARGAWRADGRHSFVRGPAPTQKAVAQQRIGLDEMNTGLWRNLRPVSATAADYLRARKCLLPPPDCDLRSTETLRHPSGHIGPALVALVTDASTGEPMTLHRTWVKADGTKADVHPPRLLLGGHRKRGGVIRLFPVSTRLAIAEGIESALTLAAFYVPAWSTIDAGNLAAFPVLDSVAQLVIGVDNDPAGRSAARECAYRWRRAGRRVRFLLPPVEGHDLNDHVRARSELA